jgi:hypothetical protein
MAVTARRTAAKVKSSAMSPRQPEVPNLIGDAEMLGEALIFFTSGFVSTTFYLRGSKYSDLKP